MAEEKAANTPLAKEQIKIEKARLEHMQRKQAVKK